MNATVSEFDWDDGNRAKCQKHGVSPAEVEALFARPLLIIPDEEHSRDERRLRAIGKDRARSLCLFGLYRPGTWRKTPDSPNYRPLHAPEGGRQL